MAKDLVVIGGFPETYELCEEAGWHVCGVVDFDAKVMEGAPADAEFLGPDQSFIESRLKDFADNFFYITPDKPQLRRKIASWYLPYGIKFATLISPDAKVSKQAQIGEAVIVQQSANIMSKAKLGDFSRVNVGATIMHHSVLGEYVTVAPHAVVLGYVTVGDGAYIGANATILSYLKIGANAVIGAGAVVTKDVPAGMTVVGVPAKELKKV